MYCEECDTGCSVDGTGDNCTKEPDHDYTDLYGNALRCKCSAGYLKSLTWTTAYDDADGDWYLYDYCCDDHRHGHDCRHHRHQHNYDCHYHTDYDCCCGR